MKHRFSVLDIFRGIFASAVVFFHMAVFSNTPILNNRFIGNADLFVDFFFVLSGFVICYSYREINNAQALGAFLKKRFFRLYPLHFIMLMVFLLVEGIKVLLKNQVHISNLLDNSPTTFFSSLFLINSIKLPGVYEASWNGVSWSISAEWISYIVFAVLCFLFSKLKFGRWKAIPYIFVAVISYFFIVKLTNNTFIKFTYNYGFLEGLIGFFTGTVCLYVFDLTYNRFKDLPKLLFTLLEAIVIATIFYFVINGAVYKQIGVVYEFVFFISIYVFAFESGHISQLLSNVGILKTLGKYSYSIYMTHLLIISVFNVVFIRILKLPPTAYWYLFIPNYLIVYFISAWTYKHIEMKFLKGIKSQHVIKKID